MLRWIKRILKTLAVVVVIVLVMQVVPYGRDHSNPQVVEEPKWDSPQTRELAMRACFDCHSNKTKWPWYADLAPFSWVVQRNVNQARTVLNFSDWTRPYELVPQAPHSVLAREMPPRSYKMLHPKARLTDAETEQLAKGLQATFGLRTRASL